MYINRNRELEISVYIHEIFNTEKKVRYPRVEET